MLAFPSNDFRQERGTDEDIQAFVKEHYPDVDFPIFAKGGLNDNPIYERLRRHLPEEGGVNGNFHKYLVDRTGRAVMKFGKKAEPLSLAGDIERLLEEAERDGGSPSE